MKTLSFAWLFAMLFAASQAVIAASATKDDAQNIVKSAVAAYKTGGKEKLVSDVGTPKGPFDKGDIYVYLLDMTGTLVAHPKKPELVGKNEYQVPDPSGKLFRKEMIDNAKKGNSGWIENESKNTDTGKV